MAAAGRIRLSCVRFALVPGLLIAGSQIAQAQDLQINQRLTAPTAHAETYAGLTLSQLVLALGLSLQGVPYAELPHDLGRGLALAGSSDRSRRHGLAGAVAHQEPHLETAAGVTPP